MKQDIRSFAHVCQRTSVHLDIHGCKQEQQHTHKHSHSWKQHQLNTDHPVSIYSMPHWSGSILVFTTKRGPWVHWGQQIAVIVCLCFPFCAGLFQVGVLQSTKWRSSRRSSTQKAGRAVRYHDSLDIGASHCLHVVCRFKKDDGLHTVLYVTKPILNLGKVTTWHTFCLHVMLSHSQPESFFT